MRKGQKRPCLRSREEVNALVLANRGLVHLVARRYFQGVPWMDLEDIVQEGHIGLIRAAELFDPARGIKFSTYAVGWISNVILRAISPLTKPARAQRILSNTARFGHLSAAEVAGGTMEPAAHVADGLDCYEAEALDEALAMLDSRSRAIVQARFGIGQEEQTLSEVGADHGIGKERARQIEVEAIEKLSWCYMWAKRRRGRRGRPPAPTGPDQRTKGE